ncbi:MAG: succinylglutamate-semialdehyde dehydrogenase [Sphingomonadales bacterium]|nr:MAG: succinylglutamate-semialdehyde dehydrogenase [Sphingomonadales bacterium]
MHSGETNVTEQLLTSHCPASGEIVWSGPIASAEAVSRALSTARRAFPGWGSTPLAERVAIARAYAAVLKARTDELAQLIARETGKPLWEARQEVGSMVGKVEISITAQAERTGERRSATAFGEAVLRHRPHGVMAVLGPYNFPGHLPNGHIVPALLAGNTIVFKPSELTPAVGEAMGRAWTEAGLPDGVLTVVQGARETGAALIDGDIDGLLFTGSAATGMHFRRHFADRPHVILALELGGNNPLIVWDGDVEEAAAVIVQSAFVTAGQRCSCARRLILPNGAFGDAVVSAVADLARRLPIGRWDETPEPYMGPLISDHAAKVARGQVQQLSALGARTILPLDPVEGRSAAFVAPAMLDVTGITAPDDEIFAPVLQITRVATFEAAIASANNTRFGLSAGLVTGDDSLWERFVLEARAGVVNRNRPTTGAAGSLPFGGFGESGNHRPSAYYAADYCAYPMASFEAGQATGNWEGLKPLLRS